MSWLEVLAEPDWRECYSDSEVQETARQALDLIDELISADNALKLLEEQQEAIEPRYNARTNWYECGVCHYSMTSGMHCKGELIPAYKLGFCAKCGQEVKWE